MLIQATEASRAKHKFAVKRNSWPKTRGVAMNPVDHVRFLGSMNTGVSNSLASPTVVVTTSISVRPLPSLGTLPRVKRLVSLLRGERVCCVVPRRRRTKDRSGLGAWIMVFLFAVGFGQICHTVSHALKMKCKVLRELSGSVHVNEVLEKQTMPHHGFCSCSTNSEVS